MVERVSWGDNVAVVGSGPVAEALVDAVLNRFRGRCHVREVTEAAYPLTVRGVQNPANPFTRIRKEAAAEPRPVNKAVHRPVCSLTTVHGVVGFDAVLRALRRGFPEPVVGAVARCLVLNDDKQHDDGTGGRLFHEVVSVSKDDTAAVRCVTDRTLVVSRNTGAVPSTPRFDAGHLMLCAVQGWSDGIETFRFAHVFFVASQMTGAHLWRACRAFMPPPYSKTATRKEAVVAVDNRTREIHHFNPTRTSASTPPPPCRAPPGGSCTGPRSAAPAGPAGSGR